MCYDVDPDNQLMSISFDASDLQVAGVNSIGAKLIVMASFSSKIQNKAGTYLSVTLPYEHSSTYINGKACSTTTCETDVSYFSGDTWDNSAYSWSNLARLNKVKTADGGDITITLKHTGIDFDTDNTWADSEPTGIGDLCLGGNSCKKSGSIVVIGLYENL